jgi:hypothetical protein
VPGLVVVHLLRDQRVVFWRICGADGCFRASLEAKVSNTQATCNGGVANRYNAYLGLDDMEIAV